MTATTTSTWSSTAVCRLTGLTMRQLDYADRVGLLTPSAVPATGSGSARRYDDNDVRIAAVLALHREAGLNMAVSRHAIEVLKAAPAEHWFGGFLLATPTWAEVTGDPVSCLQGRSEALASIVDLDEVAWRVSQKAAA